MAAIRSFGTDKTNQPAQTHQSRSKPIVISVEAAIGTGKSSLLKLIQKREPSWVVVQEPVDMWQKVGGQHNLLEHFYNDFERYAFSFQTYCFLTRIEAVTKAVRERQDSTPVIVVERSWFTDKHTFAEMLKKQGRISDMEWCLYEEWYNFAARNAPTIHGHVYLDCSTETCMARLRKRGRSEETTVTSEYQTSLIEHHEMWANDHVEAEKLCRIDVNDDFINNADNSDAMMEKLHTFVKSLQ
ncbi:deoxynucleoside kinase, putative [Bodo saltans]|uniref:Deoxynucleoside kinase, putative n=1 Tax=Bodo saltans TaxID=75058 RepID=A0A0S4KLM8_BODSA|nr:deoxynucleoside kinase, putative [Bodo saltans]|eukprot:CUI14527.1 deoxynucleoside kinase, putative [Bodo saltans]